MLKYTEIARYYKILLLHILFIILFILFTNPFVDDNVTHSIERNTSIPNIIIYFFMIIIAPIMEELIFRYPLKFNYLNIIVSPIILTLFIINDLVLTKIFLLLYFINILIQVLTKKNLLIYCFSITSFALIHLENYNYLNESIINNFILIFPQLLLAIILTFLRIKKNVKECIIYHSIYNFSILLIYIMVDEFYS